MKLNIRNIPLRMSLPRDLSFYIVALSLFAIIILSVFNIKNSWVFIVTALVLPFVFTYATGLLFMRILRINSFDREGKVFRIISFSLIGLIINGSLFFLLGLFRLFTGPVLIGYILSVLIVYVIRNNNSLNTQFNNRIRFDSIAPIILISLFSLGVALWFQPLDSFPDLVGWDTYTHMLTVRIILMQDGISELNLVYLPIIHYFYAAVSLLTDTDPFLLYWGSIYFIFPISGASLYLLGLKLSGNKLIGMCTGIFGVTIGSTNEVLGLIFPYPSTYGLIIAVLANTILLTSFNKRFGIIYIFSSALVYFPAIATNFIILVGTWLFKTKRTTYYAALAATIVVFVIGLYFGGSVLGGGGIKLSTEAMLQTMNASYVGERGLILVMLGAFFMYYQKAINRRIILIWISSSVIFVIMMSGWFVSAYRLEEFIRPYIAFTIAYGLGSLCVIIPNLIMEHIPMNRKS
jgi:hypothetical protein